jgi:GTP cyclohydrolase II
MTDRSVFSLHMNDPALADHESDSQRNPDLKNRGISHDIVRALGISDGRFVARGEEKM